MNLPQPRAGLGWFLLAAYGLLILGLVLLFPEFRDPNIWFKDSASVRDLIVSIAALGGVPFLIWREWNTHRTASAALRQAEIAEQRHQKQTEADRERRITDMFGKAVELLGREELDPRLGAIYALERIAHESERDYWPIMETLTAYVRNRHPFSITNTQIAVDAQAVLTVISRRHREYEKPSHKIDLAQTMLRGVDLENAILPKANLKGASLQHARLEGANLEGANLDGANLEGASLMGTNLTGASLAGANLGSANLTEAHLEGAYLGGANLEGNPTAYLKGAYLMGANLTGARLRGTFLMEAHLEAANLTGAHLEGALLGDANLMGAKLEGTVLARRCE